MMRGWRPSIGRISGRPLTFKFLLLIFKVFTQDRVPFSLLLSSSLTFQFPVGSLRFLPDQGSAASSAVLLEEPFQWFFALFPGSKKSAKVTLQVSAGVVADSSSSELSAHQMAPLHDEAVTR